jgi:DNA-binding response OmpR family regulator
LKDITILLIEKTLDQRKALSACLEESGARVDALASIAEARRRIPRLGPQLIILDPEAQTEDVLSFLSELDSLALDSIVLDGQANAAKRLDYFERGVLDVIPKPAEQREFVLRVARFYKAKRSAPLPTHVEMPCGAASLDITSRTLKNGRKTSAALTGSEFRLLYLLIQNEKRVVERREIARIVLGQGQDGTSRSIDVMISKLRRKLEDVGSERFIRSVRSEGYMLIGEERTNGRQGRTLSQVNDTQNLVGTV